MVNQYFNREQPPSSVPFAPLGEQTLTPLQCHPGPSHAAGYNRLYAIVWRLLVLESCGPAIQCVQNGVDNSAIQIIAHQCRAGEDVLAVLR